MARTLDPRVRAALDDAVAVWREVAAKVTLIRDVTPIPHNGCRPRKRRRV